MQGLCIRIEEKEGKKTPKYQKMGPIFNFKLNTGLSNVTLELKSQS